MDMRGIYRRLDIRLDAFKGYLMGFLAICISLIALCSVMPAKAATVPDTAARDNANLYTSVKILSGDTLGSIAETYNNYDNMDNSEYISEIKRINSLSSDEIHPGCYITVVYSN